MIVLFEPTDIEPVIVPIAHTTAGLVPATALLNAASVVTVVGLAVPPPVVVVTFDPPEGLLVRLN
jgi:hypothetical protein